MAWRAFRRAVMLCGACAVLAVPAQAAKTPLPPTVQPSPDPDLAHPAETYDACIRLSRTRPDQSLELAGKWIGLGGGDAAHHCEALSMIAMKSYGEGAELLEDLAEKSKAENTLRASMLEQAGQAWMLEGEPDRAYAAQTAALKLVGDNTQQQVLLLVDRAATLADAGRYEDAVTDLDAALKIDTVNADALAFRASAYRHLDKLDAALADAEQAVRSNPKNVNALLERADLYRLKQRLPEARHDWVTIVEIAPNSDAAKAAQDNMEKLDVKP